MFIGIDGPHGQYEEIYIGSDNENLPVIILNFSAMKQESENYKRTTIAHEIAHFILEHESSSGGIIIEKNADDLCEKWGFGRAYDSYDHLGHIDLT